MGDVASCPFLPFAATSDMSEVEGTSLHYADIVDQALMTPERPGLLLASASFTHCRGE